MRTTEAVLGDKYVAAAPELLIIKEIRRGCGAALDLAHKDDRLDLGIETPGHLASRR